MTRTKCIYCNQEITTPSKEHVIQNALGGLYESTDICCPQCNNYISKYIDAPFTTIFNPIISRIDKFSKTNNTKSEPPCTGYVIYNGQKYIANIKSGKVVSCPELSRQLHCDAAKLPLEIVEYKFDLQNTYFQQGMNKIAFNYALASGIDSKLLQHGLHIQKSPSDISSITFNYPLIPFYAMNPIDNYLELETKMGLYHSMILFQQHTRLWCYIDLFNTFQYYVLLSDKMPTNGTPIYKSYAQTLQKPNRTPPELDICRHKDIMIYANQYGVEPCPDIAEFSRRIKNAINKKSQKKKLSDIISAKMNAMPFDYPIHMMSDSSQMMMFYQSLHLYFNENEELQEHNFRTLTVAPKTYNTVPYPDAILHTTKNNQTKLREYTMSKFNRLNSYLCQNNK